MFSVENAFLAAIRENPDDETVRLVFADWLDECDDPRGPWVRNPKIWEWMKPDVKNPVSQILQRMRQIGWVETYRDAQEVLIEIGAAAVPELIEALDDEVLCARVVEMLGSMGVAAHPAVPQIIMQGLINSSERTRQVAIESLSTLTETAIPEWINDLNSDSDEVRSRAAEVLRDFTYSALSAITFFDVQMRDVDEYPFFEEHSTKYSIITSILTVIGVNAVPGVMKALEDADPDVRRTAADKLDSLGKADLQARSQDEEVGNALLGPDAVATLIDGLNSRSSDCRARVAEMLGDLTPSAPELLERALSALLERLEDSEVEVRCAAAIAFRNFCVTYSDESEVWEFGPKAVPILRRLLRDPGPRMRASALKTLDALIELGSGKLPVPLLIEMLSDPGIDVRTESARMLGELGGEAAASALYELIKALRDPSAQVRGSAATALGKFGTRGEPAVDRLIEMIQTDEVANRIHAAESLGAIGAAASPAGFALRLTLKHPNNSLRGVAADALGRIGILAVSELMEALQDGCEWVRERAAWGLGRLGTGAAPAVSRLIASLADESERVQNNAAEALAKIGKPAVSAVPKMIDLLRNSTSFRYQLIESLAKFGDMAPAVPILIEKLQSGDAPLRSCAAKALADLGSIAEPAVPALLNAIRDSDARVRMAVAEALGTLTPARAGNALVELLRDSAANVRFTAAKLLADADIESALIVPILSEAIRSGGWVDRYEAIRIVKKLGAEAVACTPALIDKMNELSEEDSGQVVRLVEALGSMGPAAASACPALSKLIESKPYFASTAKAALDAILQRRRLP